MNVIEVLVNICVTILRGHLNAAVTRDISCTMAAIARVSTFIIVTCHGTDSFFVCINRY